MLLKTRKYEVLSGSLKPKIQKISRILEEKGNYEDGFYSKLQIVFEESWNVRVSFKYN